jgi:hypothetical protein
MGQFINVPVTRRRTIAASPRPNADTLYSMAWVDLTTPQVFSHPDMGNRFYLCEMTDLWMIDFETPGKRNADYAASGATATNAAFARSERRCSLGTDDGDIGVPPGYAGK